MSANQRINQEKEGIESMSHFRVRGFPAWKVLVGLTGGVLLAIPFMGRALGQTAPADECASTGKSCTFTISNNTIQKVPTLFKLQAQISQAKMPLGDAVFTKIMVKVKSGTTELCSEPFNQVRVRSGVLNLEIGRALNCQLDDVVAKYNDLAFQVCIGDSGSEAGNCLKPIQMSSVPYAVKASFASQAQEAYRAELASRANYAQRVTADGAMLELQKIGSGYYDFQKPADDKIAALKAPFGSGLSDIKGGFVQWGAVAAGDKYLNLSAKNVASGELEPLQMILMHAGETNLRGKLSVLDTSAFSRLATFSEGLIATGTGEVNVQLPANFTGATTITNTGALTVGGASTFNGAVRATAGVDVTAGTAKLQSNTEFGVAAGASTSIKFHPGTIVDMSQAASVTLPSNVSAAPKILPGLAAISSGACTVSAVSPNAKFCAITSMSPNGTGVGQGCAVINASGSVAGLQLRACAAICSAACF